MTRYTTYSTFEGYPGGSDIPLLRSQLTPPQITALQVVLGEDRIWNRQSPLGLDLVHEWLATHGLPSEREALRDYLAAT